MKKAIAEFIGTFVLTLVGCGTAIVAQCLTDNFAGYLITALAFGLVIVAMAYSIGNISGCHINPAVSLAMVIRKQMDIGYFFIYAIAQVLGAIAAAAVLMLMFGAESGLGANALYEGDIIKSLIIECVLTFIFVLAICGVTSRVENKAVCGIVIGLSLVLVHLLGIGLTGTSVNPARSIGPALFLGGDALKSLWVFIVGPLAGGALAAGCYNLLDK